MENREIPIKDNKYRNNIIKNIFYAIGAAVITVLLVYLLMSNKNYEYSFFYFNEVIFILLT
ncbi:hypothetical protein GCM10008921_16820 [Metaclostridioides mangenotii]